MVHDYITAESFLQDHHKSQTIAIKKTHEKIVVEFFLEFSASKNHYLLKLAKRNKQVFYILSLSHRP